MKNDFVECSSYHTEKRMRYKPVLGGYRSVEEDVPVCWGTKERDECSCDGNRLKCTHYADVRKEAEKKLSEHKAIKKQKREESQKKYIPEIGDMKRIDPNDAFAMKDLSTFSVVENSLGGLGKEGKIFVIDREKKLSYVMLIVDNKAEWYKTGTQEDWEKYRGKQK